MTKTKTGIREVAQRAGVSIGTVSNVLNRPQDVSEANLVKVRAAMTELGFVRNNLARELRLGAGDSIGLVVLDIGNPFFAQLAHDLETEAENHGHTIIIGSSDQRIDRENRYLNLFEAQRVRGILAVPANGVTPTLKAIRTRGTPLVLYSDTPGSEGFCTVTSDTAEGGYLATKHLIETGRSRIAFAGGPLPLVADRLAGATRAAREHATVSLTLIETFGLTVDDGRDVARRALALPAPVRPDAIFAANDLLAMGVLETLTSCVSVPDDIALIGFDDISFAASATVPLTTMRQPNLLLASEALRLLEDELSSPAHTHETLRFVPELVIRESTRPAPR